MASKITAEMKDAAAGALGYDVPNATIRRALSSCEGRTTEEVREKLTHLERRFEKAGGRGVLLADRIDRLRIALAMRELSRQE